MYCSGSFDANGKNTDELSSSRGQLRLGSRKVLENKATTVTSSGEVRPSEFWNNTPLSRYTYPITTPTPPTITTTPPTVTTPTTPTPIITAPTTPTPVLNPPASPVTTTPTTPTTTTPPTSGTQSWCVARSNVPENSLQVALDYACGIGSADCKAIQQAGQCYQPITVAAHASYAFNSYYQKHSMAPGTCDFGGNAIITTTNPSYGSCIYPVGSSTVSSSTPPPATISTAPPPPTFSTTPTTPTPVYNVSTPTGGITSPTGGITTPTVGSITGGGIPTAGLGPSATFNGTPPYGSAPSFCQYMSTSFTFVLSLVVVVILG